MNSIHRALKRLGSFAGNNSLKLITACILGIHVPLIAFTLFFVFRGSRMSPLHSLLILLGSTLISSFLAFFILRRFRQPVIQAKAALDDYIKFRKIPAFEIGEGDETADLLGKLQFTIETLDSTLTDKKDLVALLSHDVRTPLSQVIGMCSLIQLTEDPIEIHEYAQILIDEMTNQLHFLEQVVRMNRMDNMEAAFAERTPTPVSELVDRAMHTLNLQTTEKTINWEFAIEKNMAVSVNPHLFAQALQNLISNAIKFSKLESRITITGRKIKNTNVIEVIDEGIGFIQADANAIFDRFTSKGKPGTMGEKSNGLGLYLTRSIIERHDGKIEAFSSGPGTGATFRISIPA